MSEDDKSYLEYLSLGLEIAVGLFAPILIGLWLDLKWDLTPWLTLSGVVVGMLIFAGTLSRLIRKFNRKK